MIKSGFWTRAISNKARPFVAVPVTSHLVSKSLRSASSKIVCSSAKMTRGSFTLSSNCRKHCPVGPVHTNHTLVKVERRSGRNTHRRLQNGEWVLCFHLGKSLTRGG